MNILMMTNNYLPFVGGVERSIETFTREYRARGHRVVIVAPVMRGGPEHEPDIIRVPAIQNFNGTDFSVQLPIPGILSRALNDFRPDIVHSHHPFLIGDTALRTAAKFDIPLVFTYHTLYELYTHYVPGDSSVIKRFVVALSAGYANLCDSVFAPSGDVAAILRERGVGVPLYVIPTGIDLALFSGGNGAAFRKRWGIPEYAFLAGFVSRIAPEKNVEFLSGAVAAFLENEPGSRFLVVGKGSSDYRVAEIFRELGLTGRLHAVGVLEGPELADTYHAMDVFTFASHTETQGLVLLEAMAAGVPVVAVDATGVRELVRDGVNGRLVGGDHRDEFVSALDWVARLSAHDRELVKREAWITALPFSRAQCAEQALEAYRTTIERGCKPRELRENPWEEARRVLKAEWDVLVNLAHAAGAAALPK